MSGKNVTWEWQGDCKVITSHAKNEDGCCVIGYKGKTWKMHRLVWTIHNGPIPEGMHILRSCNKPACISLDHLSLGNKQDKVVSKNVEWEYQDDCKIMTSHSLNASGYAQIAYKGKSCVAHRLVWESCNGPIPKGLIVMHSCDRPACINLKHLSLGTLKDNQQDMVKKGRKRSGRKMSIEQARAIKFGHPDLTGIEVAKIYGVTSSCVYSIRNGKGWKYLTVDGNQSRPLRVDKTRKLSDEQAREIKFSCDGMRTSAVAKMYGVFPAIISAIRAGRTYGDITEIV